jgi:hypothetical protein
MVSLDTALQLEHNFCALSSGLAYSTSRQRKQQPEQRSFVANSQARSEGTNCLADEAAVLGPHGQGAL